MTPVTKRLCYELVLLAIVVCGVWLQVTVGVPQVVQQARQAFHEDAATGPNGKWDLFSFGLPLDLQHKWTVPCLSAAIQSRWDALYGRMLQKGFTERQIFAFCTWFSHESVFVTLNLMLWVVYRFNLFEQYKVQQGKYPDAALVKTCLKQLAFDHFVAMPILAYLMAGFFMNTCGVHMTGELPSMARIGWEVLFSFVANESTFYWAHRLLHHKRIYKYIHKQHHSFRVTIGIASEYAHPVEEVLGNLIPTMMGPLILGSHALVLWLWIGLRLWETIDTHSGYRFPFSPFLLVDGTGRHDYHHSHNVGNFGGSLVFWDWICGTDRPYVEHMKKQASLKQKVA